MAARKEARLYVTIWKDGDFLALPPGAQRLYMFLISQEDLTHCGVIPLRPGRWARKAGGLTVAQVEADLGLLSAGPRPFTILDEDTGELLVRSLIRNDEVWKQPNVMKAARESAALVESPAIRAALLAELERIPAEDSPSKAVRDAYTEFVNDLRNPNGNPSPNPSGKRRAEDGGEPGYPQGNGQARADRMQPEPERYPGGARVSAQVTGISNPSPNPSRNPSADPSQGKGDGYGPVLGVSPNPYSPSPQPRPPAARDVQPPLMLAVPDARPGEGEGDRPRDETRDTDGLVASLREVRPDWSAASIRQALAKPGCAERPWDLVWAAAHLMAADPETKHPGRLPHDGPWWPEAATQLRLLTSKLLARPHWCGACDERTRTIVISPTEGRVIGDDRPSPCPNCHSSKARAS